MKYNPERHRRRSIRLRGYDYSQPGAYFLTVVAHERQCLFGTMVDEEIRLSEYGVIVREEWLRTAILRPRVVLDEFVIMPNHIHGIIVLSDDGGMGTLQRAPTTQRAPTVEQFGKPTSDSIPTIVRLFKSATTKRINEMRGTPGTPLWQRNYYEHVIRSDESLNKIRQYIATNPLRWTMDRENPNRSAMDEFDQWLDRLAERGDEHAR
ncbi:MAG: transposase [Candidatus Oleimicrobiaceae bacterium]